MLCPEQDKGGWMPPFLFLEEALARLATADHHISVFAT